MQANDVPRVLWPPSTLEHVRQWRALNSYLTASNVEIAPTTRGARRDGCEAAQL